MRTRTVTFADATGTPRTAQLDLPALGEPVACALLAHCFSCSRASEAIAAIARALAQERCAVLRLDFTGQDGSGEADGSATVADLVAAGRFLEAQRLPLMLLIGHSLGGAAVIRAARSLPSARAVATIAAPFDPHALSRLLVPSAEGTEPAGKATVDIGGSAFPVGQALLDELRRDDLERELRELDRPLLILHSVVDRVIGIESADAIFQAARHPKSLISLDQANHLLTDLRDARYVAAVLAGWARRYLPEAPPLTTQERKAAGVTTLTGRDGYRTEVRMGAHAQLVDEPVSAGGTDAGPGPYDQMMAALGACTGITLRMYADRKGWPLEEVEVHLRHGRVHGEDREACPDREVRLDRIDREVFLRGPLDAEQRARLALIADRCPVHRSLSAGMFIHTALAPEEGA